MKNFIVAFAVSVVLLSCTTDQSKKLDVVGQINQDMIKNPSAAGGTGTNYYVCDDGDDDANDGLSEETPWKSFAKGMSKFKSMQAGDAVLFCRGGVFTTLSSEKIANFNCSVDAPCIISDYYNPVSQVEDAIPLIISQHSGAVFSFQDGGNADHDEGYLLENFNIKGPSGTSGTGFFFYNDVDDVRFQNITISSFAKGFYIAGANTPNEGSNKYNERITASAVSYENIKHPVLGSTELMASLTVLAAPIIEDSAPAVEEKIISVAKTNGSYYVCDTGDDLNGGDSPYAPWRTYEKAMQQFNSLNAGESINFCRGGIFHAETLFWLFNTKCDAENVCRVGDYYDQDKVALGSLERPKIISVYGGIVFNFQNKADARQDGGYLIENLILESAISKKAAIFLFNDVDDLTIRNVKIDSFKIGFQSAGTNALSEGSNKHNERIIFENNVIVNNSGQGWLGGCSDCVIRSNYFENNGFDKAIFDHNFYFSAHNDYNVIIENNTLKKSTNIDGICQGVSLVMHGKGTNITIENNLIEETVNKVKHSCWGIAVDPGYGSWDDESFDNLIIRGNTVINTGNLGIGCASCTNVLVENNTIISHNDIGFTAVKIPNRSDDLVKSSNVVVKNNKVTLSSSIEKNKFGFWVYPEDGNLSLNNNKVYSDYENVICASLQGVDTVGEEQCIIVKN